MMTVMTFLLSAVYVIACLFLIFVVLIQKGEGGGLGGLAGGGAVDVAFGAKADMTWKRATGVAAALFIGIALVLGVLQRPTSAAREAARKQQEKEAADKAAADKEKAEKAKQQSPSPASTAATHS